MPRMRRQAKLKRATYTDAHVFQLVVGTDFFGDGFGRDIDAMRAAWPILCDRAYDLLAERHARGLTLRRNRPWAAERFGDG